MQGIIRLPYCKTGAVVESSIVCAVDVCTMVQQTVERLAVMGEVSDGKDQYTPSKQENAIETY
jgi:hypothetical protein